MPTIRPHLLATLICAALAAPAMAANSLPEAVEQAIVKNPEVLTRYHQLRAAENEQGAARGNWLPRVDLQAYAGQERRDYPNLETDWYDRPGASIELRQILFDGFATSNDVKRLGYNKLARYYDLLAVSDEIALNAAQAYADVVRYRRLEELARENWATHREVFGQIEERVKAGVGRRVDLEQAAGRLALAQSNWLTETSNLHDVTQRYRRIVGTQPANTLANMPDVAGALPQGGNPVSDAVSANPAFQAAVASLRAARAETDLRRATYMPNLELRVGQNWDQNIGGAPGNYNETRAQVVLNYNLFRGGSDNARIKQASELYYAAIDIRDKTCRDVAQQTSIALNDVRALREQIGYQRQHALSTEKARDAYRQQFDIGQRTLLDLLDTENELFEARRALTRAEVDALVAEYRLLAQAHRILPALNLAPLAKEAPDEDRADAPAEDKALTCATELVQPRPLDTAAALAGRPPRSDALSDRVRAAALSSKQNADALFSYGSDQLLPNGTAPLDKFASDAARFMIERITVIGHTDRMGSPEFNRQLSERRAATVRDYLIKKGLPANKFEIVGKGSAEPLAKCEQINPKLRDNKEYVTCLGPDRRVVIELQGQPKP
ncbi:TolC family outer membrane protein [Niveibacterium sp. 24ML]|uniref:TolC family outer membrane protein n=1 Tax=Niveibacterium sp. 24ML TaxID=2985512 RepID=UPI002B4BD3EB|nr:TolC family outer membrane protein [Niveibacterium sp. 24ML]